MPIKITKPLGFTPLELIEKFKKDNNISKKVSFAGRLDPMAYGLMIILVGDECKKQDLYCGKDKIYEFNIIYGFETDSLDILGISKKIDKKQIDYKKLIGKIVQPFPVYSSKTLKIDGVNKPLWWWAKNGKLDKSMIPKKEVEIYEIDKLEEKFYNSKEIYILINDRLSKLSDKNKKKFRYDKILLEWRNNLFDNKIYRVDKFKTKVSSGTYIRAICKEMGGVAFDINRVNIIF
tara:strand:+ start:1658 stop:2359 length:702 start_codon:yes stop_codon:yes gene_type:complete